MPEGETFGLSCFLRMDDEAFHNYFTTDRALEAVIPSSRCPTGRRSAGRRIGRIPPKTGRNPNPRCGGAATTSIGGEVRILPRLRLIS
jgi:Bacterial protein of unknown function (DUF899)